MRLSEGMRQAGRKSSSPGRKKKNWAALAKAFRKTPCGLNPYINFSETSNTADTGSPSSRSDGTEKWNGLSVGGRAGIVVGCIVAVALIGIACFLLWKKRRANPQPIAELPAEKTEPPGELDGGTVSEMYVTEQPGEFMMCQFQVLEIRLYLYLYLGKTASILRWGNIGVLGRSYSRRDLLFINRKDLTYPRPVTYPLCDGRYL